MPTIWDLLPASHWPTEPSIPTADPGQGSGWSPSPAAPWESAAPTPSYQAPDAMTSSIPPGTPGASFGLLSQYDAYRDPDLADEAHGRQMLADAKRAAAFAQWVFGPPSETPQRAVSAQPALAATTLFPTAPEYVALNGTAEGAKRAHDLVMWPFRPPVTQPPPPSSARSLAVGKVNSSHGIESAPLDPPATPNDGLPFDGYGEGERKGSDFQRDPDVDLGIEVPMSDREKFMDPRIEKGSIFPPYSDFKWRRLR